MKLARLTETLRRFLFAEAIHGDALFSYSGGKAREVAIRRDEAKAIEPSRMQKIHSIDHERDVGRVLPDRIGEILVRHDGMCCQNLRPSLEPCAGKIAINAPNARFAYRGNLFEQPGGYPRRRVIGINENCELGRMFERR